MKMRNVLVALAVTVTLLVMGFMAVTAQPIRQPFEWIIAKRLTVNTTTRLIGDVTTGADLTVMGDASVGDGFNTESQSTLVVTNSTVFTPTGYFQPISASLNVTPVIAVLDNGTHLLLVNVSTRTITITDTTTRMMAGNFGMGQRDALELISDGTRWLEISRSNN